MFGPRIEFSDEGNAVMGKVIFRGPPVFHGCDLKMPLGECGQPVITRQSISALAGLMLLSDDEQPLSLGGSDGAQAMNGMLGADEYSVGYLVRRLHHEGIGGFLPHAGEIESAILNGEMCRDQHALGDDRAVLRADLAGSTVLRLAHAALLKEVRALPRDFLGERQQKFPRMDLALIRKTNGPFNFVRQRGPLSKGRG